MNRIVSVTLAAFFTVSFFSLAEEPRVKRKIVLKKASTNFEKYLGDDFQWNFEESGTLSLSMDGDSTVFMVNGGKEVFRLEAPEYISQAVVSDNGQTLFLVAMKSRGVGSDYATLIKVKTVAGKLEISRKLESGTKLFGDDRWWVSEVGAVSDDGNTILAKLGVNSADKSRVGYRWYTIAVADGKILGEGLKIGNGKLFSNTEQD